MASAERKMDEVIMAKIESVEKCQAQTVESINNINISLAKLTTELEINNKNFERSINNNTMRSKKNEAWIRYVTGALGIIVTGLSLLKICKVI